MKIYALIRTSITSIQIWKFKVLIRPIFQTYNLSLTKLHCKHYILMYRMHLKRRNMKIIFCFVIQLQISFKCSVTRLHKFSWPSYRVTDILFSIYLFVIYITKEYNSIHIFRNYGYIMFLLDYMILIS